MNTTLVREFRANLRLFEQVIDRHLRADTCCHGVSVAQCHTLLAIEILGAPSLNDLSSHIRLDKSTLSRTVESLVQADLLARHTDANDRRVTRLSLTGKGQKVCDGINQANDVRYSTILANLGGNSKDIVKTFSALVQEMAAERSYETRCTPSLRRNTNAE